MRNSIVSRPTPPSSCKALTRQLIFTKTRSDNLNGIKNLNLWGNDLQDLSLLKEMPNLQVISLSVNNIKTLKYFENCVKLKELYLRKNNIQVLNEIEYLMNLPELKVLWLCDNPCANVKNYREIIIKNLPFLTKLDNDLVTPNEREKYCSSNQQISSGQKQYSANEQVANSKVMPQENNFISVKLKTNNYLNELEENQSRYQPNEKHLSERNTIGKKPETPLKSVNKGKKSMSYEQERTEQVKQITKIIPASQSVRKPIKNNERDTNEKGQRIQNEKYPKALVGNVDDMINGGVRSSVHQGRKFNEFDSQQRRQQVYQVNQQFMKIQSTPNSHLQQYSSVKKQSYPSPIKQTELIEETEAVIHQKGSSPNIIMAIMSLLDDLEIDGLQIIKRQTERKLVEKRHQQKMAFSSAVKSYKKQ